jgi:dipeptidyl aminopeptidase/acylaminoacyl peptidase
MSRPVTPDVLFELKFLHSVTVSPSGAQIAYALSEYNGDADTDFQNIWLLEVKCGRTRRLTHGTACNTLPSWSPDGQTLAFLSDRGNQTQIYLLPLNGGEARQLTNLPQGVAGGPVWSPDGSAIAFSATKEEEAPIEPDIAFRVTRHVYRFDGMGYLDALIHDLYLVDVADGAIQQLTNDENHNTAPHWSPDGRRLLFTVGMRPDTHDNYAPELAILDLSDPSISMPRVDIIVSAKWGDASPIAAWLPDSRSVAFVGQVGGLPIGSKSDLFIVDIEGGVPENRTAGLPEGVGGRMQPDMPAAAFFTATALPISSDGSDAYVKTQIGGTIQIWRVALDGEESFNVVMDGDRSCLPLALNTGNDALFALVSTLDDPLNIIEFDLDHRRERQLTTVNADTLGQLAAPMVEHFTFGSIDGVSVEGWMLFPPGAIGPHPTVLYIHGGPHSAFGHLYHFDMQMLVGAGYGVLMINHRASTGYGDAFSTAIKGDWGNLDYADLMAGVDVAIERGWADPNRLGVCGLSGGGNLTCWIVGQTDRFKAAVPENPVTNWLSFYGTSDVGVWFSVEQLGGHPHQIPETYAKCSPITYAHGCTTPTLLVQCESDWRCPAEQAEQFYNVLKANGCVVEMVRLPGGSHIGAIAGPPNLRRAQNEALLDWMDRYVR